MKKTLLLSLAMSLVFGSALGGCVDNDRSLTIMYALEPTMSDNMCEFETVSPDNPEGVRMAGQLDLAHPWFGGQPFYMLALQVNNNLPTESLTCPDCNLNPYDVQLERMEVRYSFELGRESIESSQSSLLLFEDQVLLLPLGSALPASSNNIVMGIPVISPQQGGLLIALEDLANEVVLGVSIKLIGTTLGGERIESNEFMFPIFLCWGCLSAAACGDGSYPGCYPGQELTGCGG